MCTCGRTHSLEELEIGVCMVCGEPIEKEEKMFYQQGDVLVKKVDKIEGKKLDHLTLAKGEVTGHHHTITKGEAELYEDNGTLYLRVMSEKAELTHQEHDTIILPKGDYIVQGVREYDHWKEEVKRVQD